MKARDLLAPAIARLRAAGVEDPARDARRLLAHAMGLVPDRLTLHLDAVPDGTQLARWNAAVAARAARQPVSQIAGGRLFWGRTFRVTLDTLDPRPETETLIAAALEQPFARVLDLGTGTGCILLTLLAERSAATGLGTDLSAAALDVARENARRLGLADRAAFARGDWFGAAAGRFDLIVSNPPYIAEGELAALAPEVRDWEPRAALSPGSDGLAACRVIVAGAPSHLAAAGRLVVETGATQGQAVAALMGQAGFTDIAIRRDLDGRDRVVSGRLPAASR